MEPTTSPSPVDLSDPQSVAETLAGAVSGLAASFAVNLPRYVLAVIVFVLGVLAVRLVLAVVRRGFARSGRSDQHVATVVTTLLRVALVVVVALLALSIAGVHVGAALAGLGIAGLALAFALQSILENLVAGILILLRHPFRRGDQIITNDYEGTVADVNLRVTRLVDYDGELVLVPNAMVFTSPLVNLTQRGSRRSQVTVGIDYRDDHDAAREVLRRAVTGTEGVLANPAPEVLLSELAESSVNFELRYWTLPDIRSVLHTRDRVLSAAKRAIEDAGMTIPWPIRTLSFDTPRSGDGRIARSQARPADG